jgi:D-aspartate ligase
VKDAADPVEGLRNQRRSRPAVVVGLCAHGLAIVRALSRAGIDVIALEANRQLPGVRTSTAEICFVPDINGTGLIVSLLELARERGFAERPVLFLTNDRMVGVVGNHTDELRSAYDISWGACSDRLLPLLSKDNIESRCKQTDLAYPRSVVVRESREIDRLPDHLRFPVIIKPVEPLSVFKTLVVESPDRLTLARNALPPDAALVAQEFVPGADTLIRFGALFLDRGIPIARFEGRKLRSRPMGHTTIAVSEPNELIFELTKRFFSGLDLSGPVSLEMKQTPDGGFCVIEPTVGRTDFWIDLCTANGVNLPLVEYSSVSGDQLPAVQQADNYIWINGERDPAALLWIAVHQTRSLFWRRIRGVYFNGSDRRPFLLALVNLTRTTGRSVCRIARRKLSNLVSLE